MVAKRTHRRRGSSESPGPHSWLQRYGFAWVTLALFLITLSGHWVAAWFAYIDEQQADGQPVEVGAYLIEVTRDTLENWQSEFLQLIWQVGGLAILFYVGSPQSKEGDDRKEEKLDAVLRAVDPAHGERVIEALDRKHPRA